MSSVTDRVLGIVESGFQAVANVTQVNFVSPGTTPKSAQVEPGTTLVSFLEKVGVPFSTKQVYYSQAGAVLNASDDVSGAGSITAVTSTDNGVS